MKALSRTSMAVAVVAMCLALAGRAWAGNSPGTGITGTVHDFAGATGTGGFSGTANSQPVGECTFCHTTHRALSTTLMWNHSYSGSTYSWDVTTTTSGTNYPTFSDTSFNGPTAKCLSCHDGTVAIGQVNWFDQGHSGSNHALAAGTLNVNPKTAQGLGLTTTGLGTATQSTSMSGVHPVAMPYPWNGQQNTYNGSTTGVNYYPGQWQNPPLGNVRLWMQNGGTVALGYNGSTATTNPSIAGHAGVECTSCHDVHNRLTFTPTVSTSTDTLNYLLVGDLAGEGPTYLCNMCHIK